MVYSKHTNQSCVLSIINDKKTAVKDQCQFTVLTDYIKPHLFIIDRSHVWFTNISNAKIKCSSGVEQNVTCSATCRVVIPCRCALYSDVANIPQRMTGCKFGDISVAHGVNLALLQHFFSESQLSDIWGNSLLPDPGNIYFTGLKKYQGRIFSRVRGG